MRNKRLLAGLLFVGVVAAVAVIAPLTGYPSLWHRGHDMPTEEYNRMLRFDRAPLLRDLADGGFALGNAAHIRIYKAEATLEVWLQRAPGESFRLFRAFDICTFSGNPGPKLKEGDRQAPEGFYRVGLSQLNPESRHHLAFNIGFPNQYDVSLGRTGSEIMVHGGCSSTGCYAMTDPSVDQIYAMVEAALNAGQGEVDVHIFPFRMTDSAMADTADSDWAGYWRNLKEGFDLFQVSHVPPTVGACRGRYVFGDALDDPDCVPITGWRS
jgi:murein L,D-transpeptidase YafK